MDKLWAPWRKTYLVRKPAKTCFICRIKNSSRDPRHLILHRGPHSFAVLNRFPYNNGHTMVVPNRHVNGLEKLRDAELLDLFHLTNQLVRRLKKIMKPHGLNLGVNLGRAGGAGLLGHVHVHVVPRWNGDTNFMPIVAETKIISESLRSVYARLKWSSVSK